VRAAALQQFLVDPIGRTPLEMPAPVVIRAFRLGIDHMDARTVQDVGKQSRTRLVHTEDYVNHA
jgi:hypothetical protein